MDLRTSEAFWLMKNGYMHSFPAFVGEATADVCVIGAGITGALAAYALAKEGVEVVVVEKRHPGMGSTAASTALLQYEIDEPLTDLIDKVGRERATRSYLACHQAIDAIERIVRDEGLDVDFRKCPSLQYASFGDDVKLLEAECRERVALGLEVALLPGDEVKKRFGFSAPAGLWSKQGAQVDAYELAQALLTLPGLDNLRVHDVSEVLDIDFGKDKVRVRTEGGEVTARKLVIACGYESQEYLARSVVELRTTYALASKPIDPELFWENRTLIWETKDPYLYLRTPGDNRLILGGRDDESYDRKKRDESLPGKIKGLVREVKSLWPDLPLTPDFCWAGAFGGTEDSLPYVGGVEAMPNTYFILGFGGNGIVFSQTGAEITRDWVLGKKHENADLYIFDR